MLKEVYPNPVAMANQDRDVQGRESPTSVKKFIIFFSNWVKWANDSLEPTPPPFTYNVVSGSASA